MQANAVPLLALFERKMRLEVPLYQRPYVWSRDLQWEPLWEDIARKFTEFLEGRKDAPVHFLGAMVLDQKQTPSTHVEKRQVIDGQQRLTTLQIFLAAFRDFCREEGCEELAKEFEGYTLNTGMMAEKQVEKFKVWPTQTDRAQFSDVVTLGSRAAVEEKHPAVRKKGKRTPEPRPRMVEAYLFFADRLREYFVGSEASPPIAVEVALAERIEEAFQALKNALKVVAIDLEKDDDAQVIFETLNARGEPLLPADLLRNYIFLRAARGGEAAEDLYETHWKKFDDEFWRREVQQGRLSRPRSDLFMQHFLASRKMTDIPIKHLFVEYKGWIEREKPFGSIREEVETLAAQREHFRRLIEPAPDDPLAGFVKFLDRFELRTVYPLLLSLLAAKITVVDLLKVCSLLESYLVRRAVLGWQTKNYTRIFLILTKALSGADNRPQALEDALSTFRGPSFAWPTDADFETAWRAGDAYHELNNAKLVHVFGRLSEEMRNRRTEILTVESQLSIEHIMPQNWVANWPLRDGTLGLTPEELDDAVGERATATDDRNDAVQTIGNLTILTQELNSTVSNSPWSVKKPALLRHSLLPINLDLQEYETWDEAAIERRGEKLFQHAVRVWPSARLAGE